MNDEETLLKNKVCQRGITIDESKPIKICKKNSTFFIGTFTSTMGQIHHLLVKYPTKVKKIKYNSMW